MYIYCTNTQELTRQQNISPSKCSVIQFRYPCLDNGSDLYGKKTNMMQSFSAELLLVLDDNQN